MILDTDVLNTLVSPRCPQSLRDHLAAAEHPLYTTAATWGEICYGIARLPSGETLRERYRGQILPVLEILPFDEAAAETYGLLRAKLEGAGQPLAEADLMIAAIALTHGLPLVTGNVQHFARIPELVVHNWLAEG